jgi:hypothetical protein
MVFIHGTHGVNFVPSMRAGMARFLTCFTTRSTTSTFQRCNINVYCSTPTDGIGANQHTQKLDGGLLNDSRNTHGLMNHDPPFCSVITFIIRRMS